MSRQPALSILIPWFERDELAFTLAANEPCFRNHDAEVLVLNCAGSSERLRGLIESSGVEGVDQLDIARPRFNKSLALNLGLAQARANLVFTLDADIVMLSPIPVEQIEEGSLVTIEWIYESVPHTVQPQHKGKNPAANRNILELAFRNGTTLTHQLSHHDHEGNRRSGMGMLLAKRDDLIKVEGYNSNLEEWGWEDDDILLRLKYLLSLNRIQTGAALHLSHGDDRRCLQGTRSDSDRRNFLRSLLNYNRGKFLGTYSSDVAVTTATRTICGTAAAEGARPAPRIEDRANLPGAGAWPPSLNELLVEAALLKLPLENCRVLLLGMQDSRLQSRLAPCCREITALGPGESTEELARGTYDVIVDARLVRAASRGDVRAMIEEDLPLLAAGGWVAAGLGGECELDGTDGFEVSKLGCGAYALAPSRRLVP